MKTIEHRHVWVSPKFKSIRCVPGSVLAMVVVVAVRGNKDQ